jgi:tetratricopeptide (TPR) repeat protein/regulation of enolase protein 1 (concanavalin A-like superfamily)
MAKVLMVCVHVVLAAAGGTQDMEDWIGRDIGHIVAPGTATYNEETMIWTVRGGGSDIEGGADSFQYVHGPLEEDGFIIARVESVAPTDAWAKCGVMIRESTDPGSRFAAVYATPGNGVRFQARVDTAGMVTTDSSFVTREQEALRAPVWIKLERKQNQFQAYYATDKAGTQWTPIVWKPQAIAMPKIVYAGLAACSHVSGTRCEARFSNVTVPPVGRGTIDLEIWKHPKETLGRAYRRLEQLGNWRQDGAAIKKHGHLIARCLFTIARAKEISGKPAGSALPDYYRLTELLPDLPLSMEALAQIVILGAEEDLEYARKRLDTRPPEDSDRFFVAVMKDYGSRPETPERKAVLESFVRHVAKSSRFALLQQVIAELASDERGIATCKSLIQYGMAEPANAQVAVVALRYMALKTLGGRKDDHIQELLKWATTQFNDTRLSVSATAALADTYYERGSYAKVIETLEPELFSGGQSESTIVENVENALASYRANTLLQATISPERIYEALSDMAGRFKHHAVNLHCQRRIAEIKGLSLEGFEQSALKGVRYSEGGPENEVWFWRGLIAAGEGDLGTAAAAYERFLQGDTKSILAARAYYDIARTRMAIGEDAREWIAKAKALSPCEAVIRLERRLGASASARN